MHTMYKQEYTYMCVFNVWVYTIKNIMISMISLNKNICIFIDIHVSIASDMYA